MAEAAANIAFGSSFHNVSRDCRGILGERSLKSGPLKLSSERSKSVPITALSEPSKIVRSACTQHSGSAFPHGPLRRWAWAPGNIPKARPKKPVELALLPPLF